jgi:DNA-binding transcriptional MerR regulator
MNQEDAYLEPKYNLGWVVRQTGISADTIRAWEKRYHLPAPQRSDGNQRLYSDYDLHVLTWLHTKIQEGVQISKAVGLWQEYAARETALFMARPRQSVISGPASDEMQLLMQHWVDACITLDDQAANLVLDQAFSIFSHQLAARYVVYAGVKAIEAMWLRGDRTSQYLHYARQAASRKIYSLMGAYAASVQTLGTLVLATVMEEEDPFRPVYLAYLAKMAGWKTINAGPQMIAEPLLQIIAETQASALVIVANQLHTAANAFSILQLVQKKQIPVYYCGTFFERHPELLQRFPGVYLDEPWIDQIQKLNLSLSDAVQKTGLPLENTCRQMMDVYQQNRIAIEKEAQQQIPAAVLQDQHFTMANYFMQRGIRAAMTLGDLTYLEEDLIWIHRLISNMGIGKSVMPAYSLVYRKGVLKAGNGILAPLADTLERAAAHMQPTTS